MQTVLLGSHNPYDAVLLVDDRLERIGTLAWPVMIQPETSRTNDFCLDALTGFGAEKIISNSSSVLPCVSTAKKYQMTVSKASQPTKTRINRH